MKKKIGICQLDVVNNWRANLNKAKPSLRDYERCIKDISKIIAVQLKPKNNSEKVDVNEVMEEVANDGTAE